MKRFLKGILGISSIALLILASCKKDGALVTTNGGDAGTLTPSTTTPALDKSKVTDTAKIITFKFTPAKYTYSAATTYALQIDAAGDNWKNPASVNVSTKSTVQSYSTADFNSILLKLNLPAGVSAKVNVRMQYALSTAVNVYSNVASLTVTPFNLTSYVYAVGAFQGWNIGNQDSLISATGNNIYIGALYFPAGSNNNQFLLTPVKGSYNNKYATTEPVTGTSSVVTVGASNNLCAPTVAGEYIVTLNLNANPYTISFQAVHAYSVIGSATPAGWGTDTQLSLVNDGTNNTWVVHNLAMTAGEYKFRQDNAWAVSWGPSATDGTIVTSGAVGDGNIQLATAGNYAITFTMPVMPLADPALATTTFTITKQ
jgi:starch-binding outer membrane protein SusE/F